MEFKADSSIKRVLKNGFYTAIRFGIFTLTGIFFIPFLVKEYGTGSYGLIALAGFLTQYIGFIAGCIGSSIGRFLNVALNKSDWQEANEIFSTALAANLALVILQIPFFTWAIWKLDFLIDFPPDLGADFRILVSCNVVSFLISIMIGVLGTPLQASNRIDISLMIASVFQLARLACLILLITTLGAKLWIIGAVDLVFSIFSSITTYYFCRRLARDLVFKKKHVVRKWVKPVMNMAGWSIVAGLGQILFQKTDVWIVNRFVDIKLAGVCAALLLWPNFVQQIAKNVSSLLMPVVMIDYANGRIQRIRDVVLLGTKLFSMLSLFACGGIMVFGGFLLEVWMDESYRQYQWILLLMLLHFPLTLGREAIWLVFPAFNKMKPLGISNLVSGILNIALSILLVIMGYELVGVIVATGISLVLQRTIFLSYYAARLIDIKYRQLMIIYIPGMLLVLIVFLQKFFFMQDDLMVTGIFCMFASSVYLVWLCLCDAKMKLLIGSILPRGKANGESQ